LDHGDQPCAAGPIRTWALFHPSLFFPDRGYSAADRSRGAIPSLDSAVVLFLQLLPACFLRFLGKANLWKARGRHLDGQDTRRTGPAMEGKLLPELGKYNAGQKVVCSGSMSILIILLIGQLAW